MLGLVQLLAKGGALVVCSLTPLLCHLEQVTKVVSLLLDALTLLISSFYDHS